MKRILSILFTVICGLACLQAQTVGLVLSGGGAKGIAHIGIIKALEENNVPIDYVAGTSMGAIVGAWYAMGYTPRRNAGFDSFRRFQLVVSWNF